MRISDWSSDVCSSDLLDPADATLGGGPDRGQGVLGRQCRGTAMPDQTRGGKAGGAGSDCHMGPPRRLPSLAIGAYSAPFFSRSSPVFWSTTFMDSFTLPRRSEERPGGEEGCRTCRTR